MIIRHDRQDDRYRALAVDYAGPVCQPLPANRTDWGGEGTLIGSEVVLTAAHVVMDPSVARGSVIVSGRHYSIAGIIFHPAWSWDPDPDHWRESDDIALIQLSEPVTGIEPVRLYSDQDEAGQTAVLVGRGRFGTGLTGPKQKDGRIRAATNLIERVQNQWLVFRFDDPSTATHLEGISGPGDSGGPAFIEEGGVLYIAGVSSHQDDRQQGRHGVYGVWEYYARVSHYLDWIRQATSDPHNREKR